LKTCLIIGNGPSLADVPTDFLDKYPTFGSNRVYLKYEPNYYACVNPLVIKQYYRDINRLDSLKFVSGKYAHFVPGSVRLSITAERVFAKRDFEPVYEGYTVTFVLMQIAYWYGYKRVGLVGVDHRYTFEGKPNQELIADGVDQNHFDPSYFSGGAMWNAPDLVRSEQSYRIAKDVYERAGREIVNLTPDSALDVFEREDWQTW
jgi:hypothetical protein